MLRTETWWFRVMRRTSQAFGLYERGKWFTNAAKSIDNSSQLHIVLWERPVRYRKVTSEKLSKLSPPDESIVIATLAEIDLNHLSLVTTWFRKRNFIYRIAWRNATTWVVRHRARPAASAPWVVFHLLWLLPIPAFLHFYLLINEFLVTDYGNRRHLLINKVKQSM